MKVRELMTAQPTTVQPDATLGEVATLMKQQDCGSIPVVEAGRVRERRGHRRCDRRHSHR